MKTRTLGKTIGRLALYRLLLERLREEGLTEVFSHQLAYWAGCSAAQVRSDMRVLRFLGNPARGYSVESLIASLNDFLDNPQGTNVAVAGLGDLGRATIEYFRSRRVTVRVVAAFDADNADCGRLIGGCPVFPLTELESVVSEKQINVGVLCVGAPRVSEIANRFVNAGVMGLMNFAMARLQLPPEVYVENVDLAKRLERVAYFSRLRGE